MGTWEHRAILEGNKGTREQGPPLGDPQSSITVGPLPIMLVKLSFYAPSNARVLSQKCSNYAHFSKLCSCGLKNTLFYFKEIHTK